MYKGQVFERLGEGHKAFAVLTFTIPGMPLIYSGQEAGMKKRLEFFEKDQIDWSDMSLTPFYTKLNQLMVAMVGKELHTSQKPDGRLSGK